MPKRLWTESNAGAEFSPCRQYRYSLYRHLRPARQLLTDEPSVCAFIGLNPSTADEYTDDPTVARCWKYAERWGYDVFFMLNLHPFRSTDPRWMKRHDTPDEVIAANYEAIRRVCQLSDLVVCAWGTHGRFRRMDTAVVWTLADALRLGDRVVCLGTNQDGTPKHPLYLRNDAERVPMFSNQ